jgi:hypothetical protein
MSMVDPALPKDKVELVSRIHESRAALEAVVDAGGAARLGAARDAGGWSVADHLYHIATWQQIQLARLQGRPVYAVVGLPDQAAFDTASSGDFSAINAIIVERGRALSPAEVRAYFEQSLSDIMTELVRWEYADLLRPTPGGHPILASVAGNTYEHDDEHRNYIERMTHDE